MIDLPAQKGRGVTGPDPIPLLPRGQMLFDGLPLNAVVMEALAPAIGHGALVVRNREHGAVILVRDGALVEVHAFGGGPHTRESVLTDVQGWPEAVVSAHRFDAVLVDVCESLLRGEILYTDLRLDWVEWPALLADFARRGGAYALEIFTSAGRGVTCVAMGQQALSYTDTHPELGDPQLLEAMAATREGSIRVRRLNAATFAATALGAEHRVSDAAGSAASDVAHVLPADHGPGATGERLNGNSPVDTAGEDAGGIGTTSTPLPAAADEALPDLAWVAPWQTPWRDQPAGGSDVPPDDVVRAAQPSVGDVLGDLRSIAQRRLQLSAPRVEAVLDAAAGDDRSIDAVLAEIRAMSIRGVMPATVDAMVAEMSAAVAARRPA